MKKENHKEIIGLLIDLNVSFEMEDDYGSRGYNLVRIRDLNPKEMKRIIKLCDNLEVNYSLNVSGFLIPISNESPTSDGGIK